MFSRPSRRVSETLVFFVSHISTLNESAGSFTLLPVPMSVPTPAEPPVPITMSAVYQIHASLQKYHGMKI